MSTAAVYGVPELTKFRDGKTAAFTMQFNDSMETQADFAVPELCRRGLPATFFVNPGVERYERRRHVWEETCLQGGHELGNHTLRHKGAADCAEAEREIGECCRHLRDLRPDGSALMPFCRGGGAVWSVHPRDIEELMRKHLLFNPPMGCCNVDGAGTEGPVRHARQALADGSWVQVTFHGIGGQWLSTGEGPFVELLDFLDEHAEQLWVATASEAWKYVNERRVVTEAVLEDADEHGFAVRVECDVTRVEAYGRPFTEVYDMPLTVRVALPEDWVRFSIVQGDFNGAREMPVLDERRTAQFDVLPNAGPARVTRLD